MKNRNSQFLYLGAGFLTLALLAGIQLMPRYFVTVGFAVIYVIFGVVYYFGSRLIKDIKNLFKL